MLDRVERQVDIEVGPTEVCGRGALEPQDRPHRSLLEPGDSENGRNSSRSSSSNQKPWFEIFVTSASELAGPGIPDLLRVLDRQL